MDTIRRRTFVRGAAAGALAFTVGGAEVLLLPKRSAGAKSPAQGPERRRSRAARSRRSTPWCPARATPASRISSISNARCRRTRRCSRIRIANVRPPFVNFYRAALTEIDRQCNSDARQAVRASSPPPSSRPSSARCASASIRTGRARRRSRRSTTRSAPTASTSSTARSRASSASACRTCPTSCRRRGGDMATQEKVDVAIIGAGPAGSIFADELTRAGKKVVVLEFGPGLATTTSSISSEIWGRRIKHAPRFQLAGRHNPGHGSNAGWGTGGSMLHWFANMPRLMPNDFKVKSQYGKGLDWPISYDELSPYYDRIAEDDRRLRRRGGRTALASGRQGLSDAAAEIVPARRHLRRRVQEGRHSAGADADRHQQHRIQGPAGLHLRRLVPCRLPDRRARDPAIPPPAGCAGQGRGAAAVQLCDARPHQCERRPRHRRRILRRQERAARAAGRRGGDRRLRRRDAAHHAQLARPTSTRTASPTATAWSAST